MKCKNWTPVGLIRPARNLNVGHFVKRIGKRLRRNPGLESHSLDQKRLDQEIVRYAADAERRITELNRQIKNLEELSEQDQLTGIANRRGLEKFLDAALASAERYDEVGILIFVDLDDFKQINDSYGHDAGDLVLKGVAENLHRHARRSDFVARLGGDEFVIMLSRIDPVITRILVTKFQHAIEDAVFPCGDVGLSVRASIGAVAYDRHSSRSELLSRADRAMYSQKRSRATLQKMFGAAQ